MQRIYPLLFGLFFAVSSAAFPADKLKVVTTIPDLADIARAVGGERVEVKSICKGTENIHAVRVKPSHVVAISRCDVFIQVGLSLEHSWVPGLLQTARNKSIEPGATGHVTVSTGFEAMDVPKDLSRQNAVDIHPDGNPHIHLAHGAGRYFAKGILDALVRVSPGDKATFQANFERYEAQCKLAEARWALLAKALKGKACVQYHQEFNYLLRDLGLKVLISLESKPGVPPTPGHLQKVVRTIRTYVEANPTAKIPILSAPWTNAQVAKKVVGATKNCSELRLAPMTGKGGTWLGMMEEAHKKMAKAYGVKYPIEVPEEGPKEGPK